MKALRRFIAFLLACFAVLLFPLAIWVGSGTDVLLDPETYTIGLAEQNIYNDILPITLPVLAGAGLSKGGNIQPTMQISSIAAALPPNEWRAIANELVPPQWLKNQVESGIETFFTWLRGDSDTMGLGPDFTVLQERLTGEEGREAVEDILSALPMCTGQQAAVFREIEDGSDAVMPACRPSEEYLDIARQRLTQTLTSVALFISADQPTFMEIIDNDNRPRGDTRRAVGSPGHPENDTDLLTLRLGVEAYQQMIGLFYLCPAGLIALIVVVAVRSFRSFTSWIGWTGIISGIFAIIPLLLIPIFILGGLSTSLTIPADNAETNLFATRLATGLLVSAFGQLTGPVLVQSLIGIGGGIVLLILGLVVRRSPALPPTGGSTANLQRTVTLSNN